MVNRWMGVSLFSAGIVIGATVAALWPESVVSAQTPWQCRSWTLDTTRDSGVLKAPVEQPLMPTQTWLGTAAHVEVAAAGVAIAGRYTVVACKQ